MHILNNSGQTKGIFRSILIFICTIILLTACAKQGGTVAESTVSPTPTLPPNRGPSAVFTATPDPNATPCPTVTFPTRDPNATPYVPKYTPYNTVTTPKPTIHPGFAMIEADGMESEKKIKKMLTYSFDEDNTYDIRPQSDFASEEEYVEFIKTECEKKYKENFDYLQKHKVDAWYIRFLFTGASYAYSDPIYVKITNAQMVNQINQMIQGCSAKKNPQYSIRRPDLLSTGGVSKAKFFVEKDGKIIRMFETDSHYNLGIAYFESEPSYEIPYCSDNRILFDFLNNWDKLLTQLIVENYVTQSEVNLVFN